MDTLATAAAPKSLTPSQIEDLRLAASKMNGVERRSFQAEMALKYCQGSTRLAETLFGWGRQNIEVGLAEKRTGITCVGLQSTFSGAKRWEEKQPEVALSLQQLAESHAQQDPTFKTSLAYTRLTAASALKELKELGFSQEQLPKASTMAQVLNRMGYRLRKVVKAKPQKKLHKQTTSSTTSKNFRILQQANQSRD
ncbi:ISAzo13-like element transposase-related protein [Nostoc sp.]